jgi:hypothetical protein
MAALGHKRKSNRLEAGRLGAAQEAMRTVGASALKAMRGCRRMDIYCAADVHANWQLWRKKDPLWAVNSSIFTVPPAFGLGVVSKRAMKVLRNGRRSQVRCRSYLDRRLTACQDFSAFNVSSINVRDSATQAN